MTRWTVAAALGGALCGVIVAPALAQNAAQAAAMPTKLRPPKTSEGASTVTLVVTNSRKADLVQLQAAESGLVSWKKVLGALKSGSHASAQLPRPERDRGYSGATLGHSHHSAVAAPPD